MKRWSIRAMSRRRQQRTTRGLAIAVQSAATALVCRVAFMLSTRSYSMKSRARVKEKEDEEEK
eukprot:6205534-Pleurochrysis_carterae.AAC.2